MNTLNGYHFDKYSINTILVLLLTIGSIMSIKTIDSKARLPLFKSWIIYLLTMQPWESYCFIYKMRTIMTKTYFIDLIWGLNELTKENYESYGCSVTKSCPTLSDPMDCSRPNLFHSSVLHYLLEFAQIHVHWVGDTIQPSHSLLPFFLPSVFPSSGVFSIELVLCIR